MRDGQSVRGDGEVGVSRAFELDEGREAPTEGGDRLVVLSLVLKDSSHRGPGLRGLDSVRSMVLAPLVPGGGGAVDPLYSKRRPRFEARISHFSQGTLVPDVMGSRCPTSKSASWGVFELTPGIDDSQLPVP